MHCTDERSRIKNIRGWIFHRQTAARRAGAWLLPLWCVLVAGSAPGAAEDAPSGSVAGGDSQHLDRVVAIVEDDVVLESELLSRVRTIKNQMQAAGRDAPSNDVLVNQVIERLVLESIQTQMAEHNGIVIADDQIKQAVNSIAVQNKMNVDQFIAALAHDGVSFPAFREQVRREMMISRVQQMRVMPHVFVSDQEINNWLSSNLGKVMTGDDFHVGHILLATPEGATPDAVAAAKRTADELYAKLQTGADFCALSVAHSAATNALDCGDLGWRKAPQLPSLFAEKVLNLQAGAVLEPIHTASGYHLVKLLDRRGAKQEAQETKVRHILVRPSAIRTDAESHQRALEVYKRLQAGEDFCALSTQFSEDPGTGLACGDLGWTQPEQFAPEFAAQMVKTTVGGRSEPFRTQFGWHILEVRERRQRDLTEDNRKQLAMRFLRNQRFEEELENWLAQIREDAFVQVKL